MATPNGEISNARACNNSKTPICLSTMATSTIEDIGTHAPDSLKMF